MVPNQTARMLVPAQRRELIAQRLRVAGGVTVASLETEFGVSAMTARRDLQVLEREGRAQRTHGGAVLPTPKRQEDSFQARLEQATQAKDRIGTAACRHVADGEALFVDSSTTAYVALRSLIAAGRRLTVLTSAIPVMDLVAQTDAPSVSLIGLSGSLRTVTRSFVGPQTIAAIDLHFADKLLFSINGITGDGVLTEADPLEAEVKRAMIAHSRVPILLIDGSKFERAGLSTIARLDAIGLALVADASPRQIELLRGSGTTVEEVP